MTQMEPMTKVASSVHVRSARADIQRISPSVRVQHRCVLARTARLVCEWRRWRQREWGGRGGLHRAEFYPPNRFVFSHGKVLGEWVIPHIERKRVAMLVDSPFTESRASSLSLHQWGAIRLWRRQWL